MVSSLFIGNRGEVSLLGFFACATFQSFPGLPLHGISLFLEIFEESKIKFVSFPGNYPARIFINERNISRFPRGCHYFEFHFFWKYLKNLKPKGFSISLETSFHLKSGKNRRCGQIWSRRMLRLDAVRFHLLLIVPSRIKLML